MLHCAQKARLKGYSDKAPALIFHISLDVETQDFASLFLRQGCRRGPAAFLLRESTLLKTLSIFAIYYYYIVFHGFVNKSVKNSLKNTYFHGFGYNFPVKNFFICHSREGGNPVLNISIKRLFQQRRAVVNNSIAVLKEDRLVVL